LKERRIVKLSNGNYCQGAKCYFPTEEVEHDEEMPRVDRAVYSSGDPEKDEDDRDAARAFLEFIGVREVDEGVLIEKLLKERYQKWSFKPDMADLPRFVAFVESHSHRASLFSN